MLPMSIITGNLSVIFFDRIRLQRRREQRATRSSAGKMVCFVNQNIWVLHALATLHFAVKQGGRQICTRRGELLFKYLFHVPDFAL